MGDGERTRANHWRYSPFAIAFGRIVHDRRMARGWTLRQLGEMANLSFQSICNIEKGRQTVSLQRLVDLADALGCTPNDLLPEHPRPPSPLLEDTDQP